MIRARSKPDESAERGISALSSEEADDAALLPWLYPGFEFQGLQERPGSATAYVLRTRLLNRRAALAGSQVLIFGMVGIRIGPTSVRAEIVVP